MTEIEKGIELTLKVFMKVKNDEIAKLKELFQVGKGFKDHNVVEFRNGETLFLSLKFSAVYWCVDP